MATTEYMIAASVGKTLREELVNLVRYVLEEEPDPVTAGIVTNSSRVSSTLGRPYDAALANSGVEFAAQHPLVFGRSGAIRYAALGTLGGHGNDVGNNPPMLLASPTYPSATGVPQRRAEWLTVGLKRVMGNLVIDDRQLMALEKGMPVDDFFVQWLKDPAEILRTQLTTDFFGDNTTISDTTIPGKVGVISAVSVVSGTNMYDLGASTVITLSSGSMRSFWRGQRLHLWDTTGNNIMGTTTNGVWMVTAVHGYSQSSGLAGAANQVQVVCVTAPVDGTIAAGASGDILCLEGAGVAGRAVSGLGNFVIDPGFSGADLTFFGLKVYEHTNTYWVHPELQSFVDVPTSGTKRMPTPLLFAKAMSTMSDRGLGMPKRWIMPRSIRDLWFQQESLFKAYNTNLGPAVQSGADGGYSGQLSITTIDGGKAEVVCSAFCPADTVYGIDMDSFVRYAPFGTDSVKFLGNNRLTGNQSFLLTVNGDGDYTSIYQQPFDYYTEWGCTAPWKLAKIGYLKDVADIV